MPSTLSTAEASPTPETTLHSLCLAPQGAGVTLLRIGCTTDEGRSTQMISLTKGDRVRVYEDPATEMKLEGIAKLICKVGQDLGSYERWKVRFEGKPGEPNVERSVRPMNRVKRTGD